MALGEAACVSVHGANRLGSNSLIDLVVFGRAAALRCAEHHARPATRSPTCRRIPPKCAGRLDKFRNASGGTPTAKLRTEHAEGDAGQIARCSAPARCWTRATS